MITNVDSQHAEDEETNESEQQPGPTEKPWNEHSEQNVDIPHQEHKKTWYDLTPERKKQLEVRSLIISILQ